MPRHTAICASEVLSLSVAAVWLVSAAKRALFFCVLLPPGPFRKPDEYAGRPLTFDMTRLPTSSGA